MKVIENNVCAPEGFKALGKTVGIKKSGKPDFAVIFSEITGDAAAVYTSNKVKGAPLTVTKNHLKDGKAQAIIINSGIANVCTGEKGIKDAGDIAKAVGKELKISAKDVLVASTGLIGAFLPMDRIKKGIKGIKNELSKNNKAAEAILTTDTVKKEIAVKVDNFTIGAIAKGSGMVHPNMATMLCFITTDAEIEQKKLKSYLKNSVNKSFNMTSVDMDTSTSDMAVIMANGIAGKVDEKKFQEVLDYICIELAKKIAKDGEGTTKLIEVEVKNAKTKKDAEKIAKAIISSNLVKCAVFGNDPNWGRIICAMGNAGVDFNENMVDMYFGNQNIVKKGVAVGFNYEKVKDIIKKDTLKITIDLNDGKENSTAFGCDMTLEYIKINALYTT
ncbi:bifunctional ornithine acetyltransferase/N-acetylglutamate synthase [Candidatus Woesearchaeota archaeon]|nr:bifunctional ornithine acetyltransferase/N-acetylglutamate synthase [Candidatus Woesearchaeota archaeon]|tara:strand:+ start:12763 stop:13926 length:1164 start_codon:yes stop_codon:yes gene_type:complete